MKHQSFSPKRILAALLIGLALIGSGCGNSAQQQAYEQAAKAEQQLTAENAPAIIGAYRKTIALQPDTDWARKAEARIEAVEARVKAEELHKNIFQEHGVD
jgi:PBP1b-binding outer membrane lipoprotein LpoB